MSEADRALRRRRLFKWAFAASLVANAFFVGLFAMHQFSERERRGGVLRVEWRDVQERLPEDYSEQVREAVRADLPTLRQDWRRLRELRGEINGLAAQDQPDRPAIDERLAEIRAITQRMQERVQGRIYDTVLEFPPDIRSRLAEEP